MRNVLLVVLLLALLAGGLGFYALARNFNVKIQFHRNGWTFEAVKPPGSSTPW